jgi:hypothetical protein
MAGERSLEVSENNRPLSVDNQPLTIHPTTAKQANKPIV